jgi:hypothetical protein
VPAPASSLRRQPPPVTQVLFDVDRTAERFVDRLAAASGFERADADARDEGRLDTPGYCRR